jgi:hypothetical protein
MTSRSKTRFLSGLYIAYFMLTMYWQFNYIGPCKFLGEIQVALFGSYWSIINFIILHIPAAIVFFGLQQQIERGKNTNESDSQTNSFFSNPIIKDLIPSVVILAITLWIVSIVSGQAFDPDLGQISLKDLETGKITRSSYYARVSGYSNDENVKTQKGKDNPWIYIALHSEPNSQAPVHLIIASDEMEVDKYIQKDPRTKKVTTQGYVESGVRGEVRAWLEKDGVKVANDVKYITPRIDRNSAKNLPIGIGIAGIVLAGYVFIQNLRER